MSQPIKRTLSIIAIIIASAAFGMILTADLGWMKRSSAQQTSSMTVESSVQPVAVTIPSFAAIADRVMPAVVSITTTEVLKESEVRRRQGGGTDPFEFFFPDPRRPPRQNEDDDERQQKSGGSGFIISNDGYILTNNHVIENATKVEVHYGDDENGNGGTTVQAKVIGRDPATDLALIKIDGTNLPTVRLGDSDRIRRGDWAIAIGNPLQFSNTMTVGVISAKGRSLGISEATQSFENFIQTDAAINFGNSGGPLLNINGEVIGINTAIRAYAQNLGFATPVNVAKKILTQLRERGKVTRGYLGISIRDVEARPGTREAFNLPSNEGAVVEAVREGEPADRAGIQNGDVIVGVDQMKVRKTRDLIDYVSDQPPGSTVKVSLFRNGQRKTVSVRTTERPLTAAEGEEAPTNETQSPARNKLGVSVQEITAGVRQRYGIADAMQGIVITDVKSVSAAGEAGLAEGDVITEVGGQRVSSIAQFREIVERAKSGQYLRMYISRPARSGRAQSFFAIVQVP
ncbi:MAG TPA: Do family serine endopeptidase [Thermoanaerobaculia bacterium]|nr:Do family serine endopeptidase [Thermoanaerobaculia bacterium]